MKFVVYKHSLVLGDNNIVTKQFIVLKHDDGNLQFTDFHRYVKSTSRIKSISDDNLIKIWYNTEKVKITKVTYKSKRKKVNR